MAGGRNPYTEDFYQEQARKMGLRARSYFKLEELDRKFRLIHPGITVLDLGAAPGSWCQYVLRKTGGRCRITAVDLQVIETFQKEKGGDQVLRLQEDIFAGKDEAWGGPFQLVLSDMAPKTMGHHGSDAALSAELVTVASQLARKHLQKSGSFVAKYLQGGEMPELQKHLRGLFRDVKIFKPESSRQRSTEVFFVCQN